MVRRLPTMWETQVQSLGQEDPLEKEMATHSSILAWKILRTEERRRVQSMGSQRVGHDWATSLSQHSLASIFRNHFSRRNCSHLFSFFFFFLVFTSFIYWILITDLVLNKLCWRNDYIKNLVLHESESVSCLVVSDSYDLVDCGPQGSSVHGVFQTRILEGVVIPFSRVSSWPRDQTQVSWVTGRFFAIWNTREGICRNYFHKNSELSPNSSTPKISSL